jgi:hypothetical protein
MPERTVASRSERRPTIPSNVAPSHNAPVTRLRARKRAATALPKVARAVIRATRPSARVSPQAGRRTHRARVSPKPGLRVRALRSSSCLGETWAPQSRVLAICETHAVSDGQTCELARVPECRRRRDPSCPGAEVSRRTVVVRRSAAFRETGNDRLDVGRSLLAQGRGISPQRRRRQVAQAANCRSGAACG